MTFYTIMEMSACVTYITRITQVTLKTKNSFNFPAHKHRLDAGVHQKPKAKVKSQHAIILHSCKSIFIIFAPS